MSFIPEIRKVEPRYEHEGFFAIYFEDNTYMEIPFYDLLSWACESDESLLNYLRNLPQEFTVYEEVEELRELGYEFKPKIPGYLRHCESNHPGFIYEFRYHVDDLPEGYLD